MRDIKFPTITKLTQKHLASPGPTVVKGGVALWSSECAHCWLSAPLGCIDGMTVVMSVQCVRCVKRSCSIQH